MRRIVILDESYRNWILDATFTESAEAIGVSIEKFFYRTSRVSLQRNFVFKEIKKLSKLESTKMWLATHRILEKFGGFVPSDCFLPKNSRVLISHLSDEDSDSRLFYNLRDFEKILTYNKEIYDHLLNIGFDRNQVRVIGGAVNRNVFSPLKKDNLTQWSKGFVLIAGDAKPRKRPQLVFEVISLLTDINFVIHGRDWQKYCPTNLLNSPNISFIDFEMVNHPSLMRSADLYLSLSEVEGGPFSTLEALASGTPVVVTNVGWNSEYVKNGIGSILERDATLDDITSAIKNSLALKETLRHKDLIPGEALWHQLGEKVYG